MGFLVIVCWVLCSIGLRVYEFGFYVFSNRDNFGYLKYESNWWEDMIGCRIFVKIEELERGKIGIRENFGDLGSKISG